MFVGAYILRMYVYHYIVGKCVVWWNGLAQKKKVTLWDNKQYFILTSIKPKSLKVDLEI